MIPIFIGKLKCDISTFLDASICHKESYPISRIGGDDRKRVLIYRNSVMFRPGGTSYDTCVSKMSSYSSVSYSIISGYTKTAFARYVTKDYLFSIFKRYLTFSRDSARVVFFHNHLSFT